MDITTVYPLVSRCVKLLPMNIQQYVTDYELICRTVKMINDLLANQNEIIGQVCKNQDDIKALQKEVDDIQAELEKIKNGEYMDVYINALACWIDRNLQCLVHRIATYVVFGLDDKGNFYADTPSLWCIGWDTIVTPGPDYGRLVLTY